MTSEEQYLDELLKNMTPTGGHERTMSQVMADMHWTTPEPVKVDDNNGIEQSFSGTETTKNLDDTMPSDSMLSNSIQMENVTLEDVTVSDIPVENIQADDVLSEDNDVNFSGIDNIGDLIDELNSDVFLNDSNNALDNISAENIVNDSSATVETIGGLDESEMAGAISAMLDNFSPEIEIPQSEEFVPNVPTDEEMSVEEPTDEEMSVEEPAAEEIVVEEPIAEETVLEEPISEETTIDESAVDANIDDLLAELNADMPQDFAEEPVVEEESIEEPTVEEMSIEEPTVEEMSIEEPAVDEVSFEEPTVEEMSFEEPTVEEMSFEEPIAEETILEEPTIDESALDTNIDDLLADLNGDFVSDISDITDNSGNPGLLDIQESEENPIEENPIDENSIEENTESVIPDGIQIGEFSAFTDSNEEIPANDNIDAFSFDEPSQASSSGDDLSQEELAAMLNEIGAFDINSMPVEEPSNNAVDDNGALSALDMLDNLGDSDEDLLNLLENIDPQSRNGADQANNEINDLLSGGNEETKEEKKARKKQEKLQKKEAKKNAKKAKTKGKGEELNEVDGVIAEDFAGDVPELGSDESMNNDNSDQTDLDNMAIDDILQSVAENDSNGDEPDVAAMDGDPELDELRDISEKKGKKGKKKKDKGDKAPGFWAKFMNMLFAEPEEEGEQDLSNEDIIAEIDAENAEAMLFEGKGKAKKAKKKKGKEKPSNESQDGENLENVEAPPKKEKKKKEKPAKEKAPKVKEPKVIVLSKAAKICLITLCITVIAVIVILSSVLPEHSDIKAARSAYFKKDYETVYRNLYSVNRNSSDEILFRRAENYLLLKRRWDSYKSRYSIGEPVEALDSLIEGLIVYQDRIEKIDADILEDCNVIYINIVDTLKNVYGLSPEDAYSLYSLDKTEYTNALYTLIYGDKYVPVSNGMSEDVNTPVEEQSTGMEEGNSQLTDDFAEEANATDNAVDDSANGGDSIEDNSEPAQNLNLDDVLPEEGDY